MGWFVSVCVDGEKMPFGIFDLCVVVSPVTGHRDRARGRFSKGRQRARSGERRRKTVEDDVKNLPAMSKIFSSKLLGDVKNLPNVKKLNRFRFCSKKDKKDGVKCIQKNGSQTKKPRC